MRLISFLREHTLCKLGHHCPPDRQETKFDGGRIAHLCCYCRLILSHER